MKIGIIVYSETGNTYSVASKLYEKLKKDGHNVKIERVEAKRDTKKTPNIFEITNSPKVDKYDTIIFASYTEAFMLCAVMKSYLESISSLQNKDVLCFATHHFPYPWLGGNNTVRKIKAICQSKGATIKKSGVISWSSKKRETKIEELINDFSSTF